MSYRMLADAVALWLAVAVALRAKRHFMPAAIRKGVTCSRRETTIPAPLLTEAKAIRARAAPIGKSLSRAAPRRISLSRAAPRGGSFPFAARTDKKPAPVGRMREGLMRAGRMASRLQAPRAFSVRARWARGNRKRRMGMYGIPRQATPPMPIVAPTTDRDMYPPRQAEAMAGKEKEAKRAPRAHRAVRGAWCSGLRLPCSLFLWQCLGRFSSRTGRGKMPTTKSPIRPLRLPTISKEATLPALRSIGTPCAPSTQRLLVGSIYPTR